MIYTSRRIKKVGAFAVGLTEVEFPGSGGREIILVPHPDNTGTIFLKDSGSVEVGLAIPNAGITIVAATFDERRFLSDTAAQSMTYAIL